MASVRHKVVVMSGKGGVGKSTFTAHLAHGIAHDDTKQVGGKVGQSSQLNGSKGCSYWSVCGRQMESGDVSSLVSKYSYYCCYCTPG